MVNASQQIKVFVCGDVMSGRGLDQIMECPGDPKIFEPFVRDARDYVHQGEVGNSAIPRKVKPEYMWGDALKYLRLRLPTSGS